MIVVVDVETQKSADDVGGWKNIPDMLVSCAVAFVSLDGGKQWEVRTYLEDQVVDLLKVLAQANVIISYNGETFDRKVLGHYVEDLLSEDEQENYADRWEDRSLDLCRRVQKAGGKMVGLNDVAACTLGSEKTGDGLEAIELYAEGRFDELVAYCRQDVQLTKDLWVFAYRYGYVLAPKLKQGDEIVSVRKLELDVEPDDTFVSVGKVGHDD